MRRLQKPQLHDDEEQEEALRAFGDEKVLQFVPQAHGAQGSEVILGETVLVARWQKQKCGSATWCGAEMVPST
jgi:hypothetical protein